MYPAVYKMDELLCLRVIISILWVCSVHEYVEAPQAPGHLQISTVSLVFDVHYSYV